MATQTKQRAAPAAARDGKGAVIAVAELEPLLEALRGGIRGETGLRLDTRRRGIVGQLNRAFNELSQTREHTTKCTGVDRSEKAAGLVGRGM